MNPVLGLVIFVVGMSLVDALTWNLYLSILLKSLLITFFLKGENSKLAILGMFIVAALVQAIIHHATVYYLTQTYLN